MINKIKEILNNKDKTESEKILEIFLLISPDFQDDIKDTLLDMNLLDRYFQNYTLADNSISSYTSKYKQFLKYAQKQNIKYVKEVSKDISEEYIRKIYKEKHTADYDIMILRKMWSDLFPKSDNPWKHNLHIQPKPLDRIKSHRMLSKKELKKINNKVEEEINIRKEKPKKTHKVPVELYEELKDCLKFSMYYGMRISSFSNMKVSDFNCYKSKKYFIHVPQKTKRYKNIPLELPILDEIKEVLDRRYDKKNEYIFPLLHERYKKGTSNISHIFHVIKDKCKIKDTHRGIASFHSYRTTFITKMDEVNAPVSITDNITGHAPQNMHNLYSKPRVCIKKKWIMRAFGLKSKHNQGKYKKTGLTT